MTAQTTAHRLPTEIQDVIKAFKVLTPAYQAQFANWFAEEVLADTEQMILARANDMILRINNDIETYGKLSQETIHYARSVMVLIPLLEMPDKPKESKRWRDRVKLIEQQLTRAERSIEIQQNRLLEQLEEKVQDILNNPEKWAVKLIEESNS